VGTEDNSTILLSVTDECLFTAEESVILSYSIAPDIQVELGEDISLPCNNPEVILGLVSVTGGQGPLSFSWSADGSMISTGEELATLVSDEETFTLTATDGCGNEGSDDITVTHAPYSPPSAYLLGDSDGCPGDMVSLYAMADEGMEPYSYFWPHNGASSEVTIDHPESSSSYSVQVTDACGNTTEAFTEIIVSPISASFFLEQTDYYGFESSNSSFSSEEDSLSYFWYVDGLLVSEQMDHGMSFTDLDDHSVTMVVVNSAGCRDSIWSDLSPPSSLYIPSGFSPDGDGVNDFFTVYHHDLQTFSIEIYDRWGANVFSSEDPDSTWNGGFDGLGEYHSGNSVYVYHVLAQGVDGRYFDLRGEVTIVR
jgi:gliding motility-associated-like protein